MTTGYLILVGAKICLSMSMTEPREVQRHKDNRVKSFSTNPSSVIVALFLTLVLRNGRAYSMVISTKGLSKRVQLAPVHSRFPMKPE